MEQKTESAMRALTTDQLMRVFNLILTRLIAVREIEDSPLVEDLLKLKLLMNRVYKGLY